MAHDRNRVKLSIGDKIKLIKSMSLEGNTRGKIHNIDGEDIYVNIQNIIIHRYGNEMEKIQ